MSHESSYESVSVFLPKVRIWVDSLNHLNFNLIRLSLEMAILRRTERAMVRAIYGAKLMEKKRTEDLMEMLGLKETGVQMAKANRVRWYRHVLRRDDGHV